MAPQSIRSLISENRKLFFTSPFLSLLHQTSAKLCELKFENLPPVCPLSVLLPTHLNHHHFFLDYSVSLHIFPLYSCLALNYSQQNARVNFNIVSHCRSKPFDGLSSHLGKAATPVCLCTSSSACFSVATICVPLPPAIFSWHLPSFHFTDASFSFPRAFTHTFPISHHAHVHDHFLLSFWSITSSNHTPISFFVVRLLFELRFPWWRGLCVLTTLYPLPRILSGIEYRLNK